MKLQSACKMFAPKGVGNELLHIASCWMKELKHYLLWLLLKGYTFSMYGSVAVKCKKKITFWSVKSFFAWNCLIHQENQSRNFYSFLKQKYMREIKLPM